MWNLARKLCFSDARNFSSKSQSVLRPISLAAKLSPVWIKSNFPPFLNYGDSSPHELSMHRMNKYKTPFVCAQRDTTKAIFTYIIIIVVCTSCCNHCNVTEQRAALVLYGYVMGSRVERAELAHCVYFIWASNKSQSLCASKAIPHCWWWWVFHQSKRRFFIALDRLIHECRDAIEKRHIIFFASEKLI